MTPDPVDDPPQAVKTPPAASRRKPQWSDNQREAARQRANKLIAAGKFGGAPGRGGRRRKHAPVAQDLLRILRAEQDRRGGLSDRQRDVLSSSAALAKVAHAVHVDREYL